jgi:hypothetical protein
MARFRTVGLTVVLAGGLLATVSGVLVHPVKTAGSSLWKSAPAMVLAGTAPIPRPPPPPPGPVG